MKNSNSVAQETFFLLDVFEKIEIGPILLEKNRLKASYNVVSKTGNQDHFELIYRYNENVFRPGDPTSENLAAMIAVQPALNYGLFCSKMIFNCPLDKADQNFLVRMAENTAREILAMKFLQHNPFLVGEAARLSPIKQEKYLTAEMKFPVKVSKTVANSENKTDFSRYAVLSSGGKDSLCSFGLLSEIGKDVHPIFINESGRHWYTAFNAFHYYRDNFLNTTKVWTNVDRLYTWMLRQLPYIRTDFHRIRSDEYPIRLWTVAVLIFAALPLIQKRGIGRIILGDEFDTTAQKRINKVSHYNGLYDQSRYFDKALTRYYSQKNWGIEQFSILRQMSEIYIEKVLVERYPELLTHQVSCHAAHKERERMKPCGKCEKCRRIIGMLVALNADPTLCGYTLEQIEFCKQILGEKGIDQETALVEYLGIILLHKGFIDSVSPLAIKGRIRPEILKLRFDPKRSPIETIPDDLQKPLISILLHHGEGAVQRKRGKWMDIDPVSDDLAKYRYLIRNQDDIVQ